MQINFTNEMPMFIQNWKHEKFKEETIQMVVKVLDKVGLYQFSKGI